MVSVNLIRLSSEKAEYVAVFESSVVGNPEFAPTAGGAGRSYSECMSPAPSGLGSRFGRPSGPRIDGDFAVSWRSFTAPESETAGPSASLLGMTKVEGRCFPMRPLGWMDGAEIPFHPQRLNRESRERVVRNQGRSSPSELPQGITRLRSSSRCSMRIMPGSSARVRAERALLTRSSMKVTSIKAPCYIGPAGPRLAGGIALKPLACQPGSQFIPTSTPRLWRLWHRRHLLRIRRLRKWSRAKSSGNWFGKTACRGS
jgi:hypothetical protein